MKIQMTKFKCPRCGGTRLWPSQIKSKVQMTKILRLVPGAAPN